MSTLYGTPKSYPYYVAVYENGSKKITYKSGVFKTKKKAELFVTQIPKIVGTNTKFTHIIIDRRKGGKK